MSVRCKPMNKGQKPQPRPVSVGIHSLNLAAIDHHSTGWLPVRTEPAGAPPTWGAKPGEATGGGLRGLAGQCRTGSGASLLFESPKKPTFFARNSWSGGIRIV